MLTCNKPPMYIRDRLNGFLPPDAYNYYNMLVSLRGPSTSCAAIAHDE